MWSITVSPWELVARGSLMYWFLFLAFRWVLRRRVGSIAITDILLLVLVADAAQAGMSGDYQSVPEGFILVSTLLAWNTAMDWATYRFKAFRRFAEPRPLPVVQDGRILRRNMRHEFVTEEELMAKLREKGIDDIGRVERAHIEADGEFSVIEKEGHEAGELRSSTRKTGSSR